MGFIAHVKEEFAVIKERDPAIKSPWEVLLYPSFRVMLKYRKAHKQYLRGHYFRARWISQRAARKTELRFIRVQQSAKVCSSIMEQALLSERQQSSGDNVTLYQGVTLGGTGKETGKRHPTLEDNVMVSAVQRLSVPLQ